jgi:hypothetical protein
LGRPHTTFKAKDPLMTPASIATVPITALLNKSPSSLGNQVYRAVLSESSSISASPFRFQDSITSEAAYGRHLGYNDSPEGEAEVFILCRTYLAEDGTISWGEEVANLAKVLRACRTYDWLAPPTARVIVPVEVLASTILKDMKNIDEVHKVLDADGIRVVVGDLLPTTISHKRNEHKKSDLSISDIAKVMDVSPALVEAIDIAEAQASGLDSGIAWRHDLSRVSASQVMDAMRVAAAIQKALKPVETGGYVVTHGKENCDSTTLALDMATKNVGYGTRLVTKAAWFWNINQIPFR